MKIDEKPKPEKLFQVVASLEKMATSGREAATALSTLEAIPKAVQATSHFQVLSTFGI